MSKIYEKYIQEFGDFLTEYEKGIIGPGKIASTGCRFTQYLAECGNDKFESEILYNIKYKEIVDSNDPITAKPMAIGKSEILAQANDEYKSYLKSKTNYESLEQMIGSLARLQKSSQAELGLSNT